MPKLKKMISRYMLAITLLMVAILIVIVVCVQLSNEHRRARETATEMLFQMEHILEENQRDLDEIKEEYNQTCLHNAQSVAYILQNNPSILNDVEELNKIATFIEVDEIHIIDKTGKIFSGTHPQFYNLHLDSGEQISFFKPMLKDKNLELCQEITANTAAGKLMQYSATWSENKEFIVQIGMEPIDVMRVTEKNELSHIFAHLRVSAGADFYAINKDSGKIVGTSASENSGKNLTEIGLSLNDIKKNKNGFHALVNGVESYCYFSAVDDNYVGRVVSSDVLHGRVLINVISLTTCLILIAIILFFTINWYINKYVIKSIYEVNQKLRSITQGNLNEKVEIFSSREFYELSSHISDMMNSLLSTTDKISYILNKTNLHIGVYEFNPNMKNVRFTEHVPKNLALSTSQANELMADYRLFKAYIDNLKLNPIKGENEIYHLQGENELYILLEELTQNNNTIGIIVDVTEEVLKQKRMDTERYIDALTGLYNRRGIDQKLDELFEEPENLGYGALIMIDADCLKEINDVYGHEKGDLYLKKLSEVLSSFGLNSYIAARQGGDEFVLFLYNYTNEEELKESLKTLRYIQYNSSAHLNDNLSVPLRFSFGYSLTKGEKNYKSLLQQADEKMYANKRARKEANYEPPKEY